MSPKHYSMSNQVAGNRFLDDQTLETTDYTANGRRFSLLIAAEGRFARRNPPGGGTPFSKGFMGTCGQPGYIFRNFCLKQGIEFIIFCLNQGIDLSIFVLNRINILNRVSKIGILS